MIKTPLNLANYGNRNMCGATTYDNGRIYTCTLNVGHKQDDHLDQLQVYGWYPEEEEPMGFGAITLLIFGVLAIIFLCALLITVS